MNKRLEKLNDYDAFVEKFKSKKTTDDCYTPDAVYDTVLKWVGKKANLKEKEVIRPFWPGADYQKMEYPANCVVIDNPPFSIITQIVRYYVEHNILFFLFSPHLTCFASHLTNICYVITDSTIVYKNGAKVKTCFLTNLPEFGEYIVMGCPDLARLIKKSQKETKEQKSVLSYDYPPNVLTVSKVASLLTAGIGITIPKGNVCFIRALDAQKAEGKGIFGSGMLISDQQAQNLVENEKKAEKIKCRKNINQKISLELSEREKEIVRNLSR